MAKQFIRVRNWGKYQHYKDRNPPWIKLYGDTMTSIDWVASSDQSRVLMMAVMMLAAKHNNNIPYDVAFLQRVCYLNSPPDFSELLALQFVELIDENGNLATDASKPLQVAIPETEKRQSTETEQKNNAPAPQAVLSSDEGLEVVKRVFDYYCRKLERGGGYTLTPKRKRQGLARFVDCMALARGQPAEAALLMKRAVDALAASKWHRDNGQIEWDLVFRSTEKLQEWLNKPQVKANGKAEQRASEIEDAGAEARRLLGLPQRRVAVLPEDSRSDAISSGREDVSGEVISRVIEGGVRAIHLEPKKPVPADTGAVDRTRTPSGD